MPIQLIDRKRLAGVEASSRNTAAKGILKRIGTVVFLILSSLLFFDDLFRLKKLKGALPHFPTILFHS